MNHNKQQTPEPIKCPECGTKTTQEELDTFGGLCEECANEE